MSDIFSRISKIDSEEDKLNQLKIKVVKEFAQRANAIIEELFAALKPLEGVYDCSVVVTYDFINTMKIEVPYEFEKPWFFSKEKVIRSYLIFIDIKEEVFPKTDGFEPRIRFEFMDNRRNFGQNGYYYFQSHISRGDNPYLSDIDNDKQYNNYQNGFKTVNEALDFFALVTFHLIAKKGRPSKR